MQNKKFTTEEWLNGKIRIKPEKKYEKEIFYFLTQCGFPLHMKLDFDDFQIAGIFNNKGSLGVVKLDLPLFSITDLITSLPQTFAIKKVDDALWMPFVKSLKSYYEGDTDNYYGINKHGLSDYRNEIFHFGKDCVELKLDQWAYLTNYKAEIKKIEEVAQGEFLGYVSPQKYFGGGVELGELFIYKEKYHYAGQTGGYNMPSEIVEKWAKKYAPAKRIFKFEHFDLKNKKIWISTEQELSSARIALKKLMYSNVNYNAPYSAFNTIIIYNDQTYSLCCMSPENFKLMSNYELMDLGDLLEK